MSSVWNNVLKLSIFGQSHGAAVGMTLDGVPAGEAVDLNILQDFMERRAPGRFPWSTSRKEEDIPEFLSGLVGDKTCGAPITAIIRNKNIRSSDYAEIHDIPRPGHADFTAYSKYGSFADVSGGGHFSGRLTAPLCIAGGLCLQVIDRMGITVTARVLRIGSISGDGLSDDMLREIERAKADGDSLGGIIECVVSHLPSGLGFPIFGGMENRISQLVFGIPAVKGIEFGAGFAAASMFGSEHNDPFYWDGDLVKTKTNNHGGILGGITSGMPLVFRTAIKPTPSIAKKQQSVSLSRKEAATLSAKGRHDPCIVPRAVPCIEAACAVAIYDAVLEAERFQGGTDI